MPAIKVTKKSFAGSARLYGENGLGAVIRGLAIDNANLKLQVAQVLDLTDNTTGTASGTTLVDLVVPSAAFDATSAGGAQLTAFNAALVKYENAGKVLTNALNLARTRLGLSLPTAATGTEATASTIPAQDKTVATASGTSAVDYVTGRAAMVKAKANLRALAASMNEVLVAIGQAPLTINTKDAYPQSMNLVAVTAASASATGASAVSKAAADAFLTGLANNLATMAAKWNASMNQGGSVAPLNVVAA